MILQIFALMIIMAVVWYFGYTKGKKIQMRELNEMEEPALTKEENDKRLQYYEFCRMYDQLMTDDDFFTGDLSKSSRTDTNKDELK